MFTDVAAVVFHLDVLYDAEDWRRWMFRLLKQMGLVADYELFFGVWDCEYQTPCGTAATTSAADLDRDDFWRRLEAYLLSVGLSIGQVDEVLAATRCRKRVLDETIRPFPGVDRALEGLAEAGVRLAVMSPWPQPLWRLRQVVAALSLERYVQDCLGDSLPHPLLEPTQCYHQLPEQLSCPPERLMLVSQSPLQIQAASRWGWRTVQTGPRRETSFADHCLGDISELSDLLAVSRPAPLKLAG